MPAKQSEKRDDTTVTFPTTHAAPPLCIIQSDACETPRGGEDGRGQARSTRGTHQPRCHVCERRSANRHDCAGDWVDGACGEQRTRVLRRDACGILCTAPRIRCGNAGGRARTAAAKQFEKSPPTMSTLDESNERAPPRCGARRNQKAPLTVLQTRWRGKRHTNWTAHVSGFESRYADVCGGEAQGPLHRDPGAPRGVAAVRQLEVRKDDGQGGDGEER